MEKPFRKMHNCTVGNGVAAMHPEAHARRYQVGDPGRYLLPGLFQELLVELERRRIDPRFGYSLQLVDPETGAIGRITGFKTALVGVVHPDRGHRDLGDYVTETGHIAICDTAFCVEPFSCDECSWMEIDEPFVVTSGPGSLIVLGSIEHVRLESAMPEVQVHRLPLAA